MILTRVTHCHLSFQRLPLFFPAALVPLEPGAPDPPRRARSEDEGLSWFLPGPCP